MIRRLFALVFAVAVVAIAVVAVRSWMTRSNEITLEIAACNKIQDPIARAVAYQADPDAAKAEVSRDPNDLGDRLALTLLTAKTGNYVASVHNMEVVVKLQPANHNYQLALCGLLLKAGRPHEAAHRLENMGIDNAHGREIARAAIDNLLPQENAAAKAE